MAIARQSRTKVDAMELIALVVLYLYHTPCSHLTLSPSSFVDAFWDHGGMMWSNHTYAETGHISFGTHLGRNHTLCDQGDMTWAMEQCIGYLQTDIDEIRETLEKRLCSLVTVISK